MGMPRHVGLQSICWKRGVSSVLLGHNRSATASAGMCLRPPVAPQDVTLGGTGKESGNRHPKIADNVLIGASSTVLGNIPVGEGALVAPGSLVLKPVPPYAMVAGAPAKQVGERPRPS